MVQVPLFPHFLNVCGQPSSTVEHNVSTKPLVEQFVPPTTGIGLPGATAMAYIVTNPTKTINERNIEQSFRKTRKTMRRGKQCDAENNATRIQHESYSDATGLSMGIQRKFSIILQWKATDHFDTN